MCPVILAKWLRFVQQCREPLNINIGEAHMIGVDVSSRDFA